MKTNVKTIAIALGALAGVAAAGRAPAGPDFQSSTTTTRAAGTARAASDGRAAIEPFDVIPFSFDSSALDAVSQIQIGEAARWLATHPGYRLVVAGHTDAAGGDAYNVGLAARRAKAVLDQLARNGIPRARVIVAIYGKASPPSRVPYAAANRVAVIYATARPPEALVSSIMPSATALLWAPRTPNRVAMTNRGPDLVDALRNARGLDQNLNL